MEDVDERDFAQKLAPEDAQSHGELADGVNRIHVSGLALPTFRS